MKKFLSFMLIWIYALFLISLLVDEIHANKLTYKDKVNSKIQEKAQLECNSKFKSKI